MKKNYKIPYIDIYYYVGEEECLDVIKASNGDVIGEWPWGDSSNDNNNG